MKRDLLRMWEWLMWALLAYAACITLRTLGWEPQVQVVLWKLGNVTVAAWCGYWIDRRAFRVRIGETSSALLQMRRATIIAAAMLAVGLGL